MTKTIPLPIDTIIFKIGIALILFSFFSTTLFTRSFQMRKMHGVDPFDPTQVDQHVELMNDLLFTGLFKK